MSLEKEEKKFKKCKRNISDKSHEVPQTHRHLPSNLISSHLTVPLAIAADRACKLIE